MQQQGEIPLLHRWRDLAQRFGWALVGLVSVILTIGLAAYVASLPWWGMSNGRGGTVPYYLDAWCYAPGLCVDYSDRAAPLRDVFPQTYGLVLMALALSVIELAFLALSIFVKRGGLGILVTGVLGSIALLVAPITLSSGLSGSYFSGTQYEPGGVSQTWGPGPGWFMAPYVAYFFLVATIFAFFAARHITQLGERKD